jgi:cytochrome c-type biogenesis protein CcmH
MTTTYLAFLAAAGAMALAAALFVLAALRAGRPLPARWSRAQMNVAVLRQQQAELARERAEGRLSDADFLVAQEDLQRRLLADVQPAATPNSAPRRHSVLLAAFALPIAAAGVYAIAGNPELLRHADVPAAQAAQAAQAGQVAQASAPGATALAQLEAHVAAQPTDARAWVLLGRARLDADQFAPAASAYERAVTQSKKVALDPQVWCEWADALALAQGTLAGKPRELIERAVALNPQHPLALEMAGSAAIEARDFRAARQHWSALLAQLDPASVEHTKLSMALAKIERLAQTSLPARQPAHSSGE